MVEVSFLMEILPKSAATPVDPAHTQMHIYTLCAQWRSCMICAELLSVFVCYSRNLACCTSSITNGDVFFWLWGWTYYWYWIREWIRIALSSSPKNQENTLKLLCTPLSLTLLVQKEYPFITSVLQDPSRYLRISSLTFKEKKANIYKVYNYTLQVSMYHLWQETQM